MIQKIFSDRAKSGRPAAAVALGVAGILGGCGFHPLYATQESGGGARAVFESIYVEPIAGERVGYDLRNDLIDDLDGVTKPAEASYRLAVRVDQYLQGIAVENNAAVTRYNYTLNANYELSDAHTGKIVKSGIETTLSAFDVVASPYATLVAQQDAQKRGAQDVADRIRLVLSAFFARRSAER